MEKIQAIANKLNLSRSFLDDFTGNAEILKIPKNHFLVEEGRVCKHIGIVQEGSLYSFTSKDGIQIVNDLYLDNAFISYYRSFLTQLPAGGSICAEKDTIIYAFSFEKYQSLMESLDWLRFFKYVADRLFIRKCARESSFMKQSATERYIQLIKLHPTVEQCFPQYRIASYLGIKPETLSRIKALMYVNKID